MQLWDYQITAINAVRQAFASGAKGVLLNIPTGGGKTVCFSHILQSLQAKGKHGVVLAHRQELIYQASKTLTRFGINNGIQMGRLATNSLANVQVCSIQSMRNRELFYYPDLIVIDEAHLINSASYVKFIERYPNTLRLLVTATPIRLDGKGFETFADTLVIGTTIKHLIELGASSGYMQGLVRPREFMATKTVDTRDVKKSGGDFNEKQLEQKVMTVELMGDLVDNYKTHAQGRKFIGFAVTVEHSKACAETFNTAGIPASHIDGATDELTRKRVLNDLKTGKIQGVFNVNVLCEGFDEPSVSAIILARPTESEALFIQQAGRGLRVCPAINKTDCIILDHGGNIDRHGSVTMEREWSLSGRVKKPKKEKAKHRKEDELPCWACFKFNPPDARVCIHCQTALKQETLREVVENEANLIELDVTDENYQIKEEYWHLLKRSRENGWKQGAAFHKLLNKKILKNGFYQPAYTLNQLARVLGDAQVPYALRNSYYN
jgi:DNA repair protein RadD